MSGWDRDVLGAGMKLVVQFLVPKTYTVSEVADQERHSAYIIAYVAGEEPPVAECIFLYVFHE